MIRSDVVAWLVLAGTVLTSCAKAPREFGRSDGAPMPPVVIALNAIVVGKAAGAELVAVEGTLAEICPTAGCWGYLADGGATLRLEFVDFTLTQEYRGKRCRVVGKIKQGADPPALIVRGLTLL